MKREIEIDKHLLNKVLAEFIDLEVEELHGQWRRKTISQTHILIWEGKAYGDIWNPCQDPRDMEEVESFLIDQGYSTASGYDQTQKVYTAYLGSDCEPKFCEGTDLYSKRVAFALAVKKLAKEKKA